MTPDDILRLAREAGLLIPTYRDHVTHLERFAALVLEEAAKECDEQYYKHIGPAYGEVRYGITACSSSIRSLKPKGEE